MEMSGQIRAAPAALPLGKDHEDPLSRRVGGPQSRAGRFEQEINILLISVMELLTVQPVAQSLRCACFTDWL